MSEQAPANTHSDRLRLALHALNKMQQRVDALERDAREPIAIVGMACRFPGARDVDGFWQMLRDGVDAVGETPADRWPVDALYDADPDVPGRMYTRAGAYVADIDRFDAQFFGIAPREAVKMDPQHRMLLEVTWEALEAAAIAPDRLSGTKTGVFVGITTSDYESLLNAAGAAAIDAYHMTGACLNFAAGRIAYTLGLQGPALAVDTACSSSLVAVHLACQSLRNRESTMAVAGGVNAILSPGRTITACKAKMLSTQGRASTFDASADGFVRGEGCGVVILKRLRDAQADGDPIFAVIRGSAVNQDGPSSGLTVPNKLAQESVIREALQRAGVAPVDIGYVEAHGTGTPLGDPIEMRALAAVLGEGRDRAKPFRAASVKTNIGHLESAAGIAGLIKTVLILQHKAIPPHLHLREPNPHINWNEIPVEIPRTLTPWISDGAARLASVSSFGGSGTNAHVVLEEAAAAAVEQPAPDRPAHVLCVSAKTQPALRELAARFEQALGTEAVSSVADVCFSANTGRAHFAHRLAVVGASREDLLQNLSAWRDGRATDDAQASVTRIGAAPKVAFLFTGQGSQRAGMGKELYRTSPSFKGYLDECAEAMRPYLDVPLLDVLFDDATAGQLLDRTEYTQPALFAVEYALGRLWMSWGVLPSVMLGHSVGEYVAACLAGVFNLADAARLITARGRLMGSLPAGGGMAAVYANAVAVAPYLGDTDLEIAALNAPDNVVVSGPLASLTPFVRRLQEDGIGARQLTVSHAFHSALIAPVLSEFEAVASTVTFRPPAVPVISNVTGRVASGDDLQTPKYWAQHARRAVRFEDSIRTAAAIAGAFLEAGPSPTLIELGRRVLGPDSLWLPSLRRASGEWQQMLRSLSALQVHGAPIDWRAFDAGYHRAKVAVPTYAFQRERYWIESGPAAAAHAGTGGVPTGHPLLGRRLRTATTDVVFESTIGPATTPFLADHQVFGVPVFPATGFVELMAAATRQQRAGIVLDDLIIREPLVFAAGQAGTVQVVVTPDQTVRCCSLTDIESAEDGFTLHAEARIVEEHATSVPPEAALADVRARLTQDAVDIEPFYEELANAGIALGPSFRSVQQLWKGEGEVLGLVALTDTLTRDASGFLIHPVLLDGCLQVAAALLDDKATDQRVFVPVGATRIHLRPRTAAKLWSHVVSRPFSAEGDFTVDIRVYDETDTVVAALDGVRFRQASRQAIKHADSGVAEYLYEINWSPAPLAASGAPAGDIFGCSPAEVIASVERCASRIADDQALAVYTELLPRIDALCGAWSSRALSDMGVTLVPGVRITLDDLLARGLQPRHRRFAVRLLEMLEEDGLLARTTDAEWEVVRAPADLDAAALQRSLEERYPHASAELSAIGRIGPELAAALTGRRDGLELLFPNGSLSLTERLYRDSPLLATHNRFVRQAVTKAVASSGGGTLLRVLEIGGGTGGATSQVLAALPPERIEYTFTDVSPMFLAAAREKFQQYPFVTYRTLDIEQDPGRQGFADAQYDIVIAANVLHATASLRQTLAHTTQVLAPGGMLVLLEATTPQRYGDLIVGLTDGWWRFIDGDLRTKHALVEPSRWTDLMAEAGCDAVSHVSDLALPDVLRHQSVIVGKKARASVGSAAGARRWLIFGNAAGVAAGIANRLRQHDGSSVVVHDLDDDSAVDGARRAVERELSGGPLHAVVHCCALDAGSTDSADGDALLARAERICGSALGAVQAIGGAAAAPRLFLVTRGAQVIAGHDAPVASAQATLWGLGRTIDLEHPEVGCLRIDLDPQGDRDSDPQLVDELLSNSSHADVAYRNGIRYVAALEAHTGADARPVSNSGLKLEIGTPGIIENLRTVPVARSTKPPAGTVEIRVAAAGLTFRDVLKTLDMYPGNNGPLGDECAGEIVQVGDGVTTFLPGDRVIAIAPGSMSSWVTADARFVAHKPASLSFEQAASIPSVFLTARYGLEQLAQISNGERVLIHAAAGGVGLAAVHMALRAGAEVFATAGSAAKREFLASIGVRHVMDSRSPDFAGQIHAATAGRGVDVILSSLTGDFIPLNLSVLSEGGRYVEIGRRGIWQPDQMTAARPDVRYFIVNLAEMFERDPGLVSELLTTVVHDLDSGSLKPLPIDVFPFDQAAEAFRRMARARHIGKIVLTPPGAPARPVSLDRMTPRASYLITGGLNGLGLAVACWMVERGARHLVLMGRSAPSETAESVIANLRAGGARISVCRGDVAMLDDVARAVADATAMAPLLGVIHSAGVLADAVLQQQDWSRFETVLAPKVRGAANLQLATRDLPLDFLVLFSSAVATLGSSAQGNHAAACAYLDALSGELRRAGRPATSIAWGPWADIGSVARHNVGERIKAHGLDTFTPRDGLVALERALHADKAHIVAVKADWRKYLRQSRNGRPVPQFFSHLKNQAPSGVPARPQAESVASDLHAFLAAAPTAQRRKLLLTYVRDQVLRVVGLDLAHSLDPQQGLRDLGIDSLMGVELRNRLQESIGRALPSTLVFDYPTLDALVDFLAMQIPGFGTETTTESEATDRDAAIAELDRLSPDEAEALLLEELARSEAQPRT